ncbi:hypothetical protein CC86DRAFT_3425 [Ophiobolus disseminans]|uniref:Uncharacterized protein n=1 Tax=Ophiobolus disseminans TaxID=1469910 RepID=A0A6A7AJW3_9PLEO|nr:hypothetical protein CC86DRAFT_3425 [Ophiobolus disseminans]
MENVGEGVLTFQCFVCPTTKPPPPNPSCRRLAHRVSAFTANPPPTPSAICRVFCAHALALRPVQVGSIVNDADIILIPFLSRGGLRPQSSTVSSTPVQEHVNPDNVSERTTESDREALHVSVATCSVVLVYVSRRLLALQLVINSPVLPSR